MIFKSSVEQNSLAITKVNAHYYEAKQFFLDNGSIDSLCVCDKNNVPIGSWLRYNDDEIIISAKKKLHRANGAMELYHQSLLRLKEFGCKVITLSQDGGSNNWNRMAAIAYGRRGKITEEVKKNFFGDYYSANYANRILSFRNLAFELKDGIIRMSDLSSEVCHVTNGERRTVGQPVNAVRNIYLFGHCYIFGAFVEDSMTIESYLQHMINEYSLPIKVINYGILGNHSFWKYMDMFSRIQFKSNDIILTGLGHCHFDDIENISSVEVMERAGITDIDMLDHFFHINPKANKILASAYFEAIKNDIFDEKKNVSASAKAINLKHGVELYLETYLLEFMNNKTKDKTVGSIVMNCNPFTNGHKYLIETAANMVDRLIIFVVQEDKSEFYFEDRYYMVYKGCSHLKNVVIVPSGPYILSSIFFPEYFGKNMNSKVKENSRNDVAFWAENVAKQLNVTHRFVGEEKSDEVTRMYNEAMKEVLPKFGIKLVEIPRKTDFNTIISASLVRKYIQENSLRKIIGLVPHTTLNFIINSQSLLERVNDEIIAVEKIYHDEQFLAKDIAYKNAILEKKAQDLQKQLQDLKNQIPCVISKLNNLANFITARIDVSISGENSKLIIENCSDERVSCTEMVGGNNNNTNSHILQSTALCMDFDIHAITGGKLDVYFRGIDIRDPDNHTMRVPYWIDYKSIKVDGNELLTNTSPAWHDQVLPLTGNIIDGTIVNIHVEWEQHQDTRRNIKVNL